MESFCTFKNVFMVFNVRHFSARHNLKQCNLKFDFGTNSFFLLGPWLILIKKNTRQLLYWVAWGLYFFLVTYVVWKIWYRYMFCMHTLHAKFDFSKNSIRRNFDPWLFDGHACTRPIKRGSQWLQIRPHCTSEDFAVNWSLSEGSSFEKLRM